MGLRQDLGPWGPLVTFLYLFHSGKPFASRFLSLPVAYIALTVLAVPAAEITRGGGSPFWVATSALLLILLVPSLWCRGSFSYREEQFAIRPLTMIVLLLRLVPLLPFNNAVQLPAFCHSCSDRGIHAGCLDRNDACFAMFFPDMCTERLFGVKITDQREEVPAHRRTDLLLWAPITLAFVYIGTTIKDLSDVTHGWSEFSTSRWVFIILGLLVSVVLIFCVTKVAKSALDKALAENEDLDFIFVADIAVNLNQPLIIKIDPSEDKHEK
ncbi:hypothetical protein NC652_024774 [Populus alba x Populus x berolinensis]|nr:hypothetical protein NC652_024774 [Populus alba x Populus x berolinensis]